MRDNTLIDFECGATAIPLACGRFTLIDSGDSYLTADRRWSLDSRGYVRCSRGGATVYLHRMLAGRPGHQVDHVNRDLLDNRRGNLRPCTPSQNSINRRAGRGTSGYRGVCWNKAVDMWQAQISRGGKYEYLGAFQSEEDAARAYDTAAIRVHGEFACLNFPPLASRPEPQP